MLGTPSLSYFKNVIHQHLHSEHCFPCILYILLLWTKVSNFCSARGLIILIQEKHVIVKLLWNYLVPTWCFSLWRLYSSLKHRRHGIQCLNCHLAGREWTITPLNGPQYLPPHDSIITWLFGTFHFLLTYRKFAVFSTFPKCMPLTLTVYLSNNSPLQAICHYGYRGMKTSIADIRLGLWSG